MPKQGKSVICALVGEKVWVSELELRVSTWGESSLGSKSEAKDSIPEERQPGEGY